MKITYAQRQEIEKSIQRLEMKINFERKKVKCECMDKMCAMERMIIY